MFFLLFILFLSAKDVDFANTPIHLLDNKFTCDNIKLVPNLKLYCNELSDLDKNIFIKLAKMNKIEKGNNFNPYLYIYKDNGQFYMETYLYLDITFDKAKPYIKDYSSYGDWILDNFNTSKSGIKDMNFLKVNKMEFDPKKKLITVSTQLNFVFNTLYKLFLNVDEQYDLKIGKKLRLNLLKPTSLTPKVEGTFTFFEIPDSKYMILYFYGFANLHWTLYNLLPLEFLRVYASEKIEIMYENIGYKIEDIKENKSKPAANTNIIVDKNALKEHEKKVRDIIKKHN